jgi:hypothetical protein
MSITFDDYIDHLESTDVFIQKVKIELLRQDESVESEIVTELSNGSGSLSVQRQNGLRRSLNFEIINIDNEYLPDINKLWWRSKFKLWLGVDINGEDYYLPQGVFYMENPSVNSNFSNRNIQIKAVDKFSVLDGTLGGELDTNYTIAVGTNIYDAIQDILDIVGDTKKPVLDSYYSSQTTPYTIEKEIGGNIGDIIIELAGMVSANVYYDVEGRLNFLRDIDDAYKSSQWNYTTETFIYLGATREYKFNELYNAVMVVGDNVNGEIYDYTATDENLLSKTSVPNVGFKRTKIIQDQNIYSNALAEERANYELKRVIALQSAISITSIPIYHLDTDEVITLTDYYLGLSEDRFLINGFTINLKTGSQMTLDIVNVVELPYST